MYVADAEEVDVVIADRPERLLRHELVTDDGGMHLEGEESQQKSLFEYKKLQR